jgi:hypothetical protein
MEGMLKGVGIWVIGVLVTILALTGLAYIVTEVGEDQSSTAPPPAATTVPVDRQDLQDLYERMGDIETLITEGPCSLLWEDYERSKRLGEDGNDAFERWLICEERNYGPIGPP